MINPKELRQLALVCRKLGITHFKCESFEMTLVDTEYKGKSTTTTALKNKKNIDNELSTQQSPLSDEELLFWSSGAMSSTTPTDTQ